MNTVRALGGKSQHLRRQRGQHSRRSRPCESRLIERVEVLTHGRQRTRVATGMAGVDERRMADAEAEEEPPRMTALELGLLGCDLRRLVHPHVQDPGRHNDTPRRLQQALDSLENRAAEIRDPQRVEPELLELARGLDRLPRVAEAELATPDAERA